MQLPNSVRTSNCVVIEPYLRVTMCLRDGAEHMRARIGDTVTDMTGDSTQRLQTDLSPLVCHSINRSIDRSVCPID